ncbi:hypothetical protein ACRAWD_24215 [Caulobacter segnis]
MAIFTRWERHRRDRPRPMDPDGRAAGHGALAHGAFFGVGALVAVSSSRLSVGRRRSPIMGLLNGPSIATLLEAVLPWRLAGPQPSAGGWRSGPWPRAGALAFVVLAALVPATRGEGQRACLAAARGAASVALAPSVHRCSWRWP